MRKHYLFGLLIFACVLSFAPIAGIIIYHQRTAQEWGNLNQLILEAKAKQDLQTTITENNQKLSIKPAFQLELLNQYSRTLPRLEKEKKFLASIPEDSLLFQDEKIISRKKTLATMPLIIWTPVVSESEKDMIYLQLPTAIEMDTDEIPLLLNIFDSNNPQFPLGFISLLEITKKTTPLNNQVWCVQAEAICR